MNRLLLRKVARGALIALTVLTALLALPLVNSHYTTYAAGSGRWAIRGHLVPAVRGLHTLAQPPDTAQALDLSISLSLRNQSGLTQLIAAQNNPHSGLYHQYLSTREFQARFSPTQATVNQVTAWLRSQGLVVHSVAANHLLIDASGSVATVEAAFQTTLASYQVNGRTVYAPTVEPSVPDALTGLIVNISGLNDVGVRTHGPIIHTQSGGAQPHIGSGPGGTYTPSDLRTAYDMNSLISSANGAGQTVAIFELDGYKASDVNTYLSTYGLGTPNYSNVLVDGATNTAGPGAIEVELDMEVVSAIAPGASQKIYIGPNSDVGVNDTYNKIVTDNIAKVTSTSWGLCEANSGTSELQTLDNIFQQGAAQGQAFFAASGDAGAYDCGQTDLGVDSPADDPNVIGVGGTTLQTGTYGSYVSEVVWSNPSDTSRGPMGAGGGGGLSSYFAQPSYQTGPGVSNPYSNGMRQVPDVSADADPNPGYLAYCTASASGCPASGWVRVGGTSAAAPLWAGIAADLNQYLTANGKPVLGSASATLYSLFNTAQPNPAYHDITSGNNLYYPATSGYDQASGIGTPDVWNIARDLVQNDFSISASPNTVTLIQMNLGNSTAVTINTARTVGVADTITFSASVSPAGPAIPSFSPTSVTAGGSTSMYISISPTVPVGTYTITVTGAEGLVSHNTTVTLNVVPPPQDDFSMSASPTSLSIAQGTTDSVTISTARISGFDDGYDIALTPVVSPTGPTVSFNVPYPIVGQSSIMSINVDTTVAPGTYVVTVTGTSSFINKTHSLTVTITVVASNGGGITNGGFETGNLTSWTPGGNVAIVTSPVTGGAYAARLGLNSPSRGDSSISQTFTVPSGYGSLSFMYQVVCQDTVNFDWATATLTDNTTSTTTTILPHSCPMYNTWNSLSTPVIAGHSYTLRLANHDDNYPGDPTYSYFDNVALWHSVANPFVNPGFEAGTLNGWSTTGNVGTSTIAHSGADSARVGSSAPFAGDSTISQTVQAPYNSTTLTFWYQVVCHDTVTYDWATVLLVDTSTNEQVTMLAPTCTNNGTWFKATAHLRAGDTYLLTITDHDDDWVGDPTYTLVDDFLIS